MSRQFPIFLDISNKKIYVYGAGKIASRRVMTLLDFSPCLTVVAPQASPKIMEASEAGMLRWVCEKYEAGTVPEDAFMNVRVRGSRSMYAATAAWVTFSFRGSP